jgi:hypothetical protein
MENFLTLIALLIFVGLACACGTDTQREKMAAKLYADAEMQKFVCGCEDSAMRILRLRWVISQFNFRTHLLLWE